MTHSTKKIIGNRCSYQMVDIQLYIEAELSKAYTIAFYCVVKCVESLPGHHRYNILTFFFNFHFPPTCEAFSDQRSGSVGHQYHTAVKHGSFFPPYQSSLKQQLVLKSQHKKRCDQTMSQLLDLRPNSKDQTLNFIHTERSWKIILESSCLTV